MKSKTLTFITIILNFLVSFAIFNWAKDNILPLMPFGNFASLIVLGLIILLILCPLDLITNFLVRKFTK